MSTIFLTGVLLLNIIFHENSSLYSFLAPCRRGGTGRRAGLKIPCPLGTCRFDSDRRHHLLSTNYTKSATLRTIPRTAISLIGSGHHAPRLLQAASAAPSAAMASARWARASPNAARTVATSTSPTGQKKQNQGLYYCAMCFTTNGHSGMPTGAVSTGSPTMTRCRCATSPGKHRKHRTIRRSRP